MSGNTGTAARSDGRGSPQLGTHAGQSQLGDGVRRRAGDEHCGRLRLGGGDARRLSRLLGQRDTGLRRLPAHAGGGAARPGMHRHAARLCMPTRSSRPIEAGVRGILCDKPLATSLAEMDRIVAACKEQGRAAGLRPRPALDTGLSLPPAGAGGGRYRRGHERPERTACQISSTTAATGMT